MFYNALMAITAKEIQAGLKARVEKCSFCQPNVKYLGYIVGRDGINKDEDNKHINSALLCKPETKLETANPNRVQFI